MTYTSQFSLVLDSAGTSKIVSRRSALMQPLLGYCFDGKSEGKYSHGTKAMVT